MHYKKKKKKVKVQNTSLKSSVFGFYTLKFQNLNFTILKLYFVWISSTSIYIFYQMHDT